MLHFLRRLTLALAPDPQATAPLGLAWPWLAMALAAVAIPWALFLAAGIGTLTDALAPAALWAALWPMLLGLLLAVALRRFGHRLPRVPEGDIVVLGAPLARAGSVLGVMLDRADAVLQQWPVAGVALLALVAILGAAILGHPE
jgi:hypothetical protein